MVYDKLLFIREQLLMQQLDIEKEVQGFPKDNIYGIKEGKYSRFYLCGGKRSIYIKKRESDRIKILVNKKFKLKQYEENELILTCLKKVITYLEKKDGTLQMIQVESPYAPILLSGKNDYEKSVVEWCQEEFEKNSSYGEHLIHRTMGGDLVRSKSEVIIANTLYMNRIPYRYEAALHLGREVVYPDFTILHPKTKKIYYFEHCGMMDKKDYREKLLYKLRLYGKYNILPSDNLILTYESDTMPVDSCQIEQIIRYYFL